MFSFFRKKAEKPLPSPPPHIQAFRPNGAFSPDSGLRNFPNNTKQAANANLYSNLPPNPPQQLHVVLDPKKIAASQTNQLGPQKSLARAPKSHRGSPPEIVSPLAVPSSALRTPPLAAPATFSTPPPKLPELRLQVPGALAVGPLSPRVSLPALPVLRRLLSDQLRGPPALVVRHLRVLSGALATNLGAIFSARQTHNTPAHPVTSDMAPELRPIVNLLNAQRMLLYALGSLWLLSADGSEWIAADASLTGTELSIFAPGALLPRYVNIVDCQVHVNGGSTSVSSAGAATSQPGYPAAHDGTIVLLQDFESHLATLRFQTVDDLQGWLSAFQLAKFEYTMLNEAFTAVMLSLVGPRLSDIYTLLAQRHHFIHFDWCNLRLPQVSGKWLKLYMAIVPSDKKKLGRVEFYTTDKINKKLLVMYINNVDSVYNVYPEDHHMIDFNQIMKVEGEIFVSKNYEHLFSHEVGLDPLSPKKNRSRTTSQTSLSSLPTANFAAPPAIGLSHLTSSNSISRSRSNSVNSTSNFFVNAPLPDPEHHAYLKPGLPPPNTGHFFKKQSASNFVTTNYLYLMPIAHPGVLAIEIMIRTFIPIIDAFRLYGRPDHLLSNKSDPRSMLFGLPSLPRYQYLSPDDAYAITAANFDTASFYHWRDADWRKTFKEFVECKRRDGDYKGAGNIADIYETADTSDSSSQAGLYMLDQVHSPRVVFPQGSSQVMSPPPLLPSKLRDSYEVPRASTSADSLELGNPIDLDDLQGIGSVTMNFSIPRGNSMLPRVANEEIKRSLEPIVDLPTPLDDRLPGNAGYFRT